MTNLPQFLRFERVELHYQSQSSVYKYALPIAKKCQSVANYVKRLKLNDTSLIQFNGTIDKNNRNNFGDHSQLIDHLRNELMPICGSSRSYKFEIFSSDKISHADLIAKILQMPQIDCCSNVEIKLRLPTQLQVQFPVEAISEWLHRNYHGIEEKAKDRFLRIYSSRFLCARELCNYLKKVTIVLLFLFQNFE